MKPQAILCDRDGTLIEEQHFLDSPERMRWISGVLSTLKTLKAWGIKVLVLTNQSGIARGYFGVDAVAAIHAKMQRDAETAGGALRDFYYCPHHPQGVVPKYSYVCNCRKPLPGLFLQAIQSHDLNPSRCWVVGDRFRDLEPGIQLGMTAFLVKTGYGERELDKLARGNKPVKSAKIVSSFPEIVAEIESREISKLARNYQLLSKSN